MDESFSRLQVIFLMLLSIGISNHVLIVPHLLQAAGRESWLTIMFGYALLIIWSIFLYLIIKSMRKNSIQDWVEERAGKIGYLIIRGGITLFLIAAGMIIVFDTTKTVGIYFLPKTHPYIIILSFIFLAYKAANSGLKTVVYISTMILPVVWIFGIGVSLFTKNNKDYGMLFPVFTQGISTHLHGLEIIVGGSLDMIMLFLIQHKLSKPLNYKTIFILLTLLAGLIMGPTMGSLAAFGPYQAENMRFPAFEQWRLVMIGRYISHVDFLAVFQMLSGSIVRTALIVYLLSELLMGRTKKYNKTALLSSSLIISLPSFLLLSDILVQDLIQHYYYSYSLWLGIAITAILFIIRFLPLRKDRNNETD